MAVGCPGPHTASQNNTISPSGSRRFCGTGRPVFGDFRQCHLATIIQTKRFSKAISTSTTRTNLSPNTIQYIRKSQHFLLQCSLFQLQERLLGEVVHFNIQQIGVTKQPSDSNLKGLALFFICKTKEPLPIVKVQLS